MLTKNNLIEEIKETFYHAMTKSSSQVIAIYLLLFTDKFSKELS